MNENRCCKVVERLTKAERDEMRDPAWRPEFRVWQELLRCLDELDARDAEAEDVAAMARAEKNAPRGAELERLVKKFAESQPPICRDCDGNEIPCDANGYPVSDTMMAGAEPAVCDVPPLCRDCNGHEIKVGDRVRSIEVDDFDCDYTVFYVGDLEISCRHKWEPSSRFRVVQPNLPKPAVCDDPPVCPICKGDGKCGSVAECPLCGGKGYVSAAEFEVVVYQG